MNRDEFIQARNQGRHNFSGVNFRGQDLSALKGVSLNFSDADCEEANLSGADFSNPPAFRAQGHFLDDLSLDAPDFRRVNFTRANLSEAKLEGVYLANAVMVGANLEKTSFEDSTLDYADLSEAVLIPKGLNNFLTQNIATSFHGASMIGIRFTGCLLPRIALVEKDLSGADFSQAQLDGGSFVKAKLPKATIRAAILDQVDFTSADLSFADLSGSSCQGTDFQAANLVGTNFSHCFWPDALPPKLNAQTRLDPPGMGCPVLQTIPD